MSDKRLIFTGDKEAFVIRMLMNKVRAAEIDCQFVPCTVDGINECMGDNLLLAMYIEDGIRPNESVLHFLADSMGEKGGQILLIGEHADIQYVCDHVPRDIIYKTLSRPVDYAKFTGEVEDYYKKLDLGEFKKSILIVDDDTQYLSLVRQWLKDTYKVSMANSGLQAIKFLGKNKVDLILLDHEMPVTSGPQVLEMLRSDDETRSIPVMFLTGKSDKESVMAVVSLKPEGYFLKNIKKEELLEKLQEYFMLHK
jgi:CheY-like chemotaxis protein